jgi:hypothetical protein
VTLQINARFSNNLQDIPLSERKTPRGKHMDLILRCRHESGELRHRNDALLNLIIGLLPNPSFSTDPRLLSAYHAARGIVRNTSSASRGQGAIA